MKRDASNPEPVGALAKKAKTSSDEQGGLDNDRIEPPCVLTAELQTEATDVEDTSFLSLTSSPIASATSQDIQSGIYSDDDLAVDMTEVSDSPTQTPEAAQPVLEAAETQPVLELPVGTQLVVPEAGNNLTYIANKVPKVFDRIMKYVLLEDHDIKPFFFSGKLRYGIYSDPQFPCRVQQPNIEIEPLLVSKAFHATGIKQLYGSNTFTFNNAENFRWWVQKINPASLASTQSLTLTISSGWFIHRDWRHGNLASIEEDWLASLCHLYARHTLSRLTIRLEQWDDVAEVDAFSMAEKVEIANLRLRIISQLGQFRNIPRAAITCDRSNYMSFPERSSLALLMAQKGTERLPETPTAKYVAGEFATALVVTQLLAEEEEEEDEEDQAEASITDGAEYLWESELRGGCLGQFFLNRYGVWGEAENGEAEGPPTKDQGRKWAARDAEWAKKREVVMRKW